MTQATSHLDNIKDKLEFVYEEIYNDTNTFGTVSFVQVKNYIYLDLALTISLTSLSLPLQVLTYTIIGFEESSDSKRFDQQSVILVDEDQQTSTVSYDLLFNFLDPQGILYIWSTSSLASQSVKTPSSKIVNN